MSLWRPMKTPSEPIDHFYPPSHRVFAGLLGVCCHVLFFVAISVMAFSLYTGLSLDVSVFGHRPVFVEWSIRLALAVSFPLFHSYLLNDRGRRLLTKLSPQSCGTGQALVSTWFVIIAALQLLLVFLLWIPTGQVLWRLEGIARIVSSVLWAGSWLLLVKAMFDSGISVQSGSLGWCSVLARRKPKYPPFATHGLFSIVRQPIYLAFLLILWTAPTMTVDSLFLAIIWSAYLCLAPKLKEARYERWHGERYREYQKQVPYLFPFWR